MSEDQLEACGVDALMLDSEGRCVVLEFPAFVIFGIYSPANSSGLRDDFRYGFLNALDMRIRNLIKQGKRVVVTGDLNVSRSEMDTANAEESMRKEGISHEQYISTPNRRIFNQLLEGGEVFGERDEGREMPVMWDICRGFHPDRRGMYTAWEQKINARPGNFGSRIDFILCSLDMKSWFVESNTQDGLHGSDHCPVYAIMQDTIDVNGQATNLADMMNIPGYFDNGKRLKEYNLRDIPAFSGKLLPEFDKRRSIKDMFIKKPSLAQSSSLDVLTAEIPTDTITGAVQFASEKITTPSPPALSTPSGSPFPVPSQASQTSLSADSASATAKSGIKRATSDAASSLKSSKRSKSSAVASKPATSASNGQQSLKGFFKPKMPTSMTLSSDAITTTGLQADMTTAVGAADASEDPRNAHIISSSHASAQLSPAELAVSSDSNATLSVHDPIVSKESWSKLFSKPIGPRCEHDEPCKIMKTKKAGFNCGREFWMCARPLGPSGAKEKGTEWRCGTFIWSSDWGAGNNKEREF